MGEDEAFLLPFQKVCLLLDDFQLFGAGEMDRGEKGVKLFPDRGGKR